MAADQDYIPWQDVHGPMACSRCGGLVTASMTDTHTADHAARDQLTQKVDDQGKEIVRIKGVLGIKVT